VFFSSNINDDDTLSQHRLHVYENGALWPELFLLNKMYPINLKKAKQLRIFSEQKMTLNGYLSATSDRKYWEIATSELSIVDW
jgi:hypothetical protein